MSRFNPPDGEPARVPRAADHLLESVYAELRALAASRLAAEAPGHTLQPTALVHEAYLRLAEQTRAAYRDRTHFFAVAAEAIRRVLVDHARARKASKRAAPGPVVTVCADLDAPNAPAVDLLALDDVLEKLAALSPRQARVVELRFFGGLDIPEVAAVLDVSENTVKGDWRLARAWLHTQLESTENG